MRSSIGSKKTSRASAVVTLLLGAYPEGEAHAAGEGRLTLEDHLVAEGATEFTLPRLGTCSVVDLPAVN
jgi:hypothetical protein